MMRGRAGQLKMMHPVLIGLAAGLASALLFASVASGSLLSVPLFYLAPLPILIAAIGWSHIAGLVAALSAATGLAFVLGGFFFVAFLAGVGLPAWWLGYLALLARPVGNGSAQALEWYPVGRIVVWAACISAAMVALAIVNIGSDEQSLRAALTMTLERMTRAQGRASGEMSVDTKRAVDLLIVLLPPAAAILATITNVFTLWLAARIVKVSGRLRRPWPELPAMTFPPLTLAALAGALLLSFAPGVVGILGTVLSASLLMAFALLGLAVLHVVTRNRNGRGFILGGLYGAIAILGWPVLLAALLGIADAALDLRARANRPPSIPGT
jgi:hypothetical protein